MEYDKSARSGRDFRFEKSQNAQFRSQITKMLTIFVITQMSLLCIFPPPMTPVQSAGILTLIINSRGPNYQIKSVMSGLTINNHSILKT